MRTKHKNRILKLAAFLRTLPKVQFNLAIVAMESSECGTVACAAGWCPTVFPHTMKWVKNEDLAQTMSVRRRNPKHVKVHQGSSLRTVAAYLGMTNKQREKTFLPGQNYNTAEHVATRLEEIVSTNGKAFA